jgi:hypothetical protein
MAIQLFDRLTAPSEATDWIASSLELLAMIN